MFLDGDAELVSDTLDVTDGFVLIGVGVRLCDGEAVTSTTSHAVGVGVGVAVAVGELVGTGDWLCDLLALLELLGDTLMTAPLALPASSSSAATASSAIRSIGSSMAVSTWLP
jgi:hypothetical protein